MRTFFRRIFACAVAIVAFLNASDSFATPTISFVTPVSGTVIATHVSPSTIPITVNAGATAGASISSVQFFANGTLIGTAAGTSPFTVQWTPAATGNYTLAATVLDTSAITTGASASTNTATVNSFVTVSTTARAATLVTSAGNGAIAQGSEIFLRATAAMSDSIVARIEFYVDPPGGVPANGSTPLGQTTELPFNVPVVLSAANGFTPGAHTIVAKAIGSDPTKTATSVPVAISIAVPIPGNSPPSVEITSPTPTGLVSVNTNVLVAANATDDGFILNTAGGGVTFFVDGDPVTPATGEANPDLISPYSITWRPTSAKTYVLRAQSVDNSNNFVLSPPVSVTAVTAIPTVVVNTAANVSVGSTTSFSATATPGSGATIVQVEFLVDGQVVGADTSNPYSATWVSAGIGGHSVTARVTDTNGTVVTSDSKSLTVTTVLASTVALSVAPSGSVGTPMTVNASTTVGGANAVTAVQFFVNGASIGTDVTAPYNILWTPTVVGTAVLTALVTDSSGATANSSAVNVTIGAGTGNQGSVALTGLVAGTALPVGTQVALNATASTVSGSTITNIQFFENGVLIGSDTSAPYSVNWTPGSVGDVSLEVRATDSRNVVISSGPIQLNILSGVPPTMAPLSLSPSSATTMPQGAVRYLLATPTAAAGRAIERVEFFIDGARVQESLNPPYTYRFIAPASSGSSIVLARATDNGGLTSEAQVTFSFVNAVGTPPTVNLIAPAPNTIVTPGTTVPLIASALDADGTVASVQFYARGVPQGAADSSSPYQVNFTPPTPGVYTIEAVATDDRGNTTISNAVNITAAFLLPTITIVSPSPATTARATPNVPLTVTAAALGGGGAPVLLVEFLLDGVPIATRTAPASGSNFSFQWTPLPDQLGAHVITARVTDANSQSATSLPLNVTVANLVGAPPTVNISVSPSPNNLQTASTVNFIGNAIANGTGNSLTGVEFFLNDVSIGNAAREQTTNLYRLAYDLNRFDFASITPTINETTGAVTYPLRLYAIARDSNNNQTVSNTSNLVINPATSTPPTIQLQALSPTTITAGTQFFIGPVFNDTDGSVVSVQLYANGVASGGALVNPQLGQILTYNANTAGRFNLYAVATDDTGNTTVSSPSIVVNVTAVSAPTTTITRPSDNATVTTVSAPVFLEGTAENPGSTQIPILQFIATSSGGARAAIPATRVGTTTTYRAIWTPTVADTYTLTTQAVVGAVAGTSTVSRRVVVANLQGLAPIATINVPGTVTTASTSNFTATATDSDGSVIGVEFFLNRNSLGQAVRDQLTNTWRLTASFAGAPLGAAEVVALARDSSGNVAASPTSNITVTAASSIAPSITVTPSTTNAAFNRQVQLTANARDADGTVNSVQYFANGTSLGTTTNGGTNYQVNWTPTQSGIVNIWGVATDNTGITTVSPSVEVSVSRNNPVLEDAAFILQTYQDIASTTTINALVFADLDARLGAGTLTRAELVASLVNEPGFIPPVNLLVAYQIIMGQWPTPQNYTTLLATARGSLANAIGQILSSPEYFAKYGTIPTVALLNNPVSVIPAATFLTRLHANAGLGGPSALDVLRFMNNDTTAGGTLGRGYNVAGLNAALAEFVTNTNAANTALRRKAQAAALYYQLNRPQVTVTVDEITARAAVLAELPDARAIADAALKDILYTYRYVTITKNPESLTVSARSGALFSVEAMGAPPLNYQWLLNGAPIAGANEAILSLTNVDASRVGSYTAVVTSSAGSSTSDPATLTLTTTPTRLTNISTRGVTAAGANVLIGGFVVTANNATQTRQMLIRVVGPRLGAAPFNVTGFLADPRLEVYRGTNPVPILTNDNWSNQAGGAAQVTAIQQATARSTFALNNNSGDAVVLATLAPGPYTVLALVPDGTPNAAGVVLIEVYDVTQGGAAGPKAANVSTRGMVGTGNNTLIAGFVVNGAASRRMLIRGAGPALTRLGVPGVLADPQLTLVAQSTGQTLRTNNNWASGDDAAIIASTANAAGAFPFASGSLDAAMIIMLPPGAYTVQLSGVNNTTGVGIVEVYDVDP